MDKRIDAIEEYFMKDRRITVWQVGDSFDIRYGTAQDSLTHVLGMRRVCARWVGKQFVPEQKTVRVQICTELQQNFSVNSIAHMLRIIKSMLASNTMFFMHPTNLQIGS